MTLTEGPRGMAVEAAKYGGYVVYTPMGRDNPLGEMGMLFAGSLADCLEFIETQIAKHYNSTEEGKN